jgi:hypothetical protein
VIVRPLVALGVLSGALLGGCSGEHVAPRAAGAGDEAVAAPVVVDTGYPRPRRGELVTRAVPALGVGRWKAIARRCAHPPSLLVLAQGDSVDVVLLVDFAQAVPSVGEYPVRPEEEGGLPRAQVGMQRVQYSDLAYRATGGRVVIERLDRYLTGRFDVVLREINVGEEVRYLGVFDRLPVESAPEAWCRRAPPDSGAG